jgi:hypothetical protein
VTGHVSSSSEAVELAGAAIDEGRALALAKALGDFGTEEAGR